MKTIFVVTCLTLSLFAGCADEPDAPAAAAVQSAPQGLSDRLEDGVHAFNVEIRASDAGPVVSVAYLDDHISSIIEITGDAADAQRFAAFMADVDPAFLAAVQAELATRPVPEAEATATLHQIEVGLFGAPAAQGLGQAESALRVGGGFGSTGGLVYGGGNGFWCEIGCNAAYALCMAACTGTGPGAVACVLVCTTLYQTCSDGC